MVNTRAIPPFEIRFGWVVRPWAHNRRAHNRRARRRLRFAFNSVQRFLVPCFALRASDFALRATTGQVDPTRRDLRFWISERCWEAGEWKTGKRDDKEELHDCVWWEWFLTTILNYLIRKKRREVDLIIPPFLKLMHDEQCQITRKNLWNAETNIDMRIPNRHGFRHLLHYFIRLASRLSRSQIHLNQSHLTK